jgi:hypothetical protein
MGYETDLTDTLWEQKEEFFEAAKNKYPSIKGCGDEGYRGTFVEFVKAKYGEIIDISENIKPKGWHILPKKWRVERIFAYHTNHGKTLQSDRANGA